MLFDLELIPLLRQSFLAHMNWILPKIHGESDRMWAEVLANKIIKKIDSGVVDPNTMPATRSGAEENVLLQYSEIYFNLKDKFEGDFRESDPIERLL